MYMYILQTCFPGPKTMYSACMFDVARTLDVSVGAATTADATALESAKAEMSE